MKWNKENKTVYTNLVSLEHCGFDIREFDGELHLMGIDDPEARWPDYLVVEFEHGAVKIGKLEEVSGG